jgi:cation-transporting ATPase 13A1
MTVSALCIAMFFFCLSRSAPLPQLSAERPHRRLFTLYTLLSVLGQFALHLFVLIAAVRLADPHTPHDVDHRGVDKTFKPNVLNSVVFLVSQAQTVATFAANYRGRPFMQSLTEHRQLYKVLLYTLVGTAVLALELFQPLNDFFEMHAMPSEEFRIQLIGLLVFDVVGTFIYARVLRHVFAIRPKRKV